MITPRPGSDPLRSLPSVAFLDESYNFARDGSREPLYVLAAVLVAGHDVDPARQRVRRLIAPAIRYHSTELARSGHTYQIHHMLTHLRDDAERSVVAIQSPFNGHANQARQACLRQLLIELSSLTVRRVVLDTRYQPRARDPHKLDKQDAHTARELRAARLIDRQLSLSHASDATEPLLWLPDGVAWSVRRAMVAGDEEHFSIIRSVTKLIVVGD